METPTKCVELTPPEHCRGTRRVQFGGVAINLTTLAETHTPPLDHSYLSRIFAGTRTPSIAFSRMLARELGMTLQGFLDELERVQDAAPLSLSA